MPITDAVALRDLCASLAALPRVAVDTEFQREKTYYAILALVQVAGDGRAEAIDTLADGIDLAPLFGLLTDESVLKLFHSASQDIAILLERADVVPAPLYDTQIAAALCGHGEQVSYASLVERVLGIALDKGSQRSDWTRRPLGERQIDYALSDVRHLEALHDVLAGQLEELGRTAWAEEEMAALADPALYVVEPREQWRRIRLRRATPRLLAVLRELAAWREEAARRRDLPRNWLLKNDVLIELARSQPKDADALRRVEGVGAGLAGGPAAGEILEAVVRGLDLPEDECPVPPAEDPRGAAAGRVARLRELLAARSEALGINAPLIANRGELERIATEDDPAVRARSGWRYEVFGAEALALGD